MTEFTAPRILRNIMFFEVRMFLYFEKKHNDAVL